MERFQLSNNLPAPQSGRFDRAAVVRAWAARPWNDRVVARLRRLTAHDWFHRRETAPGEWFDRLREELDEWDRIAAAPPIPTAAWFARQSSLPSREERARRLLRKISDKEQARAATLTPSLKPRKSWKAQANERQRVFGDDARYQRIERWDKMARRAAERMGLSVWRLTRAS